MIKKNNLRQTLDRYLAFYERRLEDGILAHIPAPPEESPVQPAVETGEPRGRKCLLLENLEGFFLRVKAQNFTNCLGDYIPLVYPTCNFGESIWSGMLGGDILFAGTNLHTWSHCPTPVIGTIETFNFPEVKEDNFWYNQMLRVTKYFADHLEPVCDVQNFIFMDCLNLLVELRGAAAYTDLYDYPDFVEKFLDWSVKENIRVFDAQASLVKELVRTAYGDHPCYKYARCNIPDISIDAYGLCRKEFYVSFGLEQHKKIVEHYGGARLHVHGNGRQLCRLVSKIEKISECWFTEDVGYANPYEIVEELKEEMHPIPIRINIPKEIFVKKLKERALPGGITYVVSGAENLNEANQIMLKVFDYRPRC
ncbi:MAG: hypothetical protein ABII89_05470 [Candidatus Omnitrophota bacterium]